MIATRRVAEIDEATREYSANDLDVQLHLLAEKKALQLEASDSLGAARTQLTIGSFLSKRFFDKFDPSVRTIVELTEAERRGFKARALEELRIALSELRKANDFGGANLAYEMIKRLNNPGRRGVGIG